MCGVDALLQEGKWVLVESKGMWPRKGHRWVREEGPVREWK